MKNISVKKFDEQNWQEYRDIRLEALSLHPNFFCPSRDETKFTADDWKLRLSNKDACTFGLYVDNKLIGTTGITRDKSDKEKAHLVASYIKSEYRQKGFSGLLYEARIQWARDQKDIKYLLVEHYEDNTPSMRAHQKFGFKFESSYDETLANGQIRKSLVYKLSL
jgi:RimJ/RimL family protein N-acetyltransferase